MAKVSVLVDTDIFIEYFITSRFHARFDSITARYSDLRRRHPALDKGDALIAATAHVKRLPLMTRAYTRRGGSIPAGENHIDL